MLFRRRKPLRLHQRLHHLMWPRRGWARAIRYYTKRLLRLSGTPHSIAAGFAAGVALSMTPFVGFHYILCFVVAFLLRINVLAAVLGTTIGNPLTFPVIWLATFETGNLVLGRFGRPESEMNVEAITHALFHDSWHAVLPVLEPMLIGSIPIAILTGGIAYCAVYYAAAAFQSARRERFAVRRRELHGSRS